MAKLLLFDEAVTNSIKKGVETLANAVEVTLGPKGRNVVIYGKGQVKSTKDGVTVAKEIAFKDPFENLAANLVKNAAASTSETAGDGTTTAVLLTKVIYLLGVKNIAAGANPMSIKKGLEKGVEALTRALDALATPIKTAEEIEQIATISANNDPVIGKIIGQAMEKVGKDGIITVAEAKGLETHVDYVEGMEFDNGYLSPYFVNNKENMNVEFTNPYILLCDKKVSTAKEIVPFLEKALQEKALPLILIAEDIEGEALSTLVLNKLQAEVPTCAIKAPGFGDKRKAFLQDIAILTGGKVVSEEIGLHLDKVGTEVLGRAKTVKISKEKTTIIEGAGKQNEIANQISLIKAELHNPNTSKYEKEKLEERLAKLSGGVARLNVGAPTEIELKEKKDRVEDAVHATRAAVQYGIVPGGGVALLRAISSPIFTQLKLQDDEAIALTILREAAFAPATAIANNCGKAGNLIAEKIYESSGAYGFDGNSGEFKDLVKAGVVDPKYVTQKALENAASIAGLLLTTETLIVDKPKPKPKNAPMGGGMPGMGGMGGMDDMGFDM